MVVGTRAVTGIRQSLGPIKDQPTSARRVPVSQILHVTGGILPVPSFCVYGGTSPIADFHHFYRFHRFFTKVSRTLTTRDPVAEPCFHGA